MTLEEIDTPSAFYLRGMERLMIAVQELSMARDLERVQEIVRTTARELAGSDGATFVLRDNDQCYYADEDAIEPLWKGSRFPLETCISGWSMINKAPAIIEDIYVDDRIPHVAYRPTFVKSLAMVPIRSLDPIGAIGNYWASGHLATDEEIKLLQALADATSIAMENIAIYGELERRVGDRTAELEQANREIQELSVTDSLTGSLNRRGFFQIVTHQLAAARSNGLNSLVAFVDVDGLKAVNDQFGHLAGDALLAHVTEALRSVLRVDDVLARVGGDEFCAFIISPPADESGLADRLLAQLDAVNDDGDLRYRLSASIGTVTTSEFPDATLDELVRAADERMYKHKRTRGAER